LTTYIFPATELWQARSSGESNHKFESRREKVEAISKIVTHRETMLVIVSIA
jgi:hypothetical protein